MIYIGRDIQYILPLIGLFVAAAFRIMPSLTRIMNCIQKIIYNRPALDTIYFEFEKNEINPVLKKINLPPLSFNDKISLKDIKFKYNHSNQYILKNNYFIHTNKY